MKRPIYLIQYDLKSFLIFRLIYVSLLIEPEKAHYLLFNLIFFYEKEKIVRRRGEV